MPYFVGHFGGHGSRQSIVWWAKMHDKSRAVITLNSDLAPNNSGTSPPWLSNARHMLDLSVNVAYIIWLSVTGQLRFAELRSIPTLSRSCYNVGDAFWHFSVFYSNLNLSDDSEILPEKTDISRKLQWFNAFYKYSFSVCRNYKILWIFSIYIGKTESENSLKVIGLVIINYSQLFTISLSSNSIKFISPACSLQGCRE